MKENVKIKFTCTYLQIQNGGGSFFHVQSLQSYWPATWIPAAGQ